MLIYDKQVWIDRKHSSRGTGRSVRLGRGKGNGSEKHRDGA